MNVIAIVSTILLAPLANAQSVSPVGFSESTHAIHAFSLSGDTILPVARLQLDVRHTDGNREQGDLVVVYDPTTGYYFWRYSKSHGEGDTTSFLGELEGGREAVYAGPSALVDFFMNSRLYAKAHGEQAHSIADAEKASMEELLKGLPVSEKSGYHTDSKEIVLSNAIGTDFACPPDGDPQFAQVCSFRIRSIPSISKEGDTWRVILRNRWDQEVILDSKFNLVSTRRMAQPPSK